FGVTGTITLTTGELLVDKSITIGGPGSDNLTVDGNLASRVFYVSSGVTATIAGIAIANGNVQFHDLPSGESQRPAAVVDHLRPVMPHRFSRRLTLMGQVSLAPSAGSSQ